MEKLPHSRFSTNDLPEKDRFGAWREDVSLLFDVEDPDCEKGAPFRATFDLYNFGQSVLAELDSSGARYRRSRKMILSDGIDSVLLQLFVEGEVQFRTGSRATYVRSGDIVEFDLNQQVDNLNSSFKHLTFMLPRALVDKSIPVFNRWHGQILPNGSPSVRLLRQHLLSSFEMAALFDPEAGRHVEIATVSLAAAAMSGCSPRPEGPASEAVENSFIYLIKRYIRSHLSSQSLSPETLANHFGVSRAQIYRVMEPVGGIASYVRDLRLHQCLSDLCDPKQAHLNISEIAYRSGFRCLSTFNRSFRENFGVAPRIAREENLLHQLLAKPPRSDDAAKHRLHHEWFREIGM